MLQELREKTVRFFDEWSELLEGELEQFRYQVRNLMELYGGEYRAAATFIIQSLEQFALANGQSLREVLHLYAAYTWQVLEERRAFKQTGSYQYQTEAEIESLLADRQFKLQYLYILTLSTPLNRSRYEVFRHYRQTLARHLRPGLSILEIGGGNCLDAAFTSRYGPVDVYELNELSEQWREILGLGESVRLRHKLYEFQDAARYDLVVMVELLEHVSRPADYLEGARRVLKDDGQAYLTFALRMPQVDHLYQFYSIEECREMLAASGFEIVEDFCAISTYHEFREEERWALAASPDHAVIYCCLTKKGPRRAADSMLEDFNADL